MNTQISDLSQIDVAILAGGLGTRIQSVVKHKPKVIAPVKDHPFLEYILNLISKASFNKVVLCTGYLSKQVENTFGNTFENLKLFYSNEQTPLGTAGGLRNALPFLTSEVVLVINGDSYCNVDLGKFWRFHVQKKANVSIVLSHVSDTRLFGKVILGDNDNVISFNEKSKQIKSGLVNTGIYLIKRSLIKEIPPNKKISLEKQIFPNWIGKRFYGFKTPNNFIDIGTPGSYSYAQQFFTDYKL